MASNDDDEMLDRVRAALDDPDKSVAILDGEFGVDDAPDRPTCGLFTRGPVDLDRLEEVDAEKFSDDLQEDRAEDAIFRGGAPTEVPLREDDHGPGRE